MRSCFERTIILTLIPAIVSGLSMAQPGSWQVVQLTNNAYHDSEPEISGSNIVWRGFDGNDYEIFLYDGLSIRQLTDNSYDDGGGAYGYDNNPRVSGSNVVWEGFDGNDCEIFLYDGAAVRQLTDNSYYDGLPQISGDKIVWVGQEYAQPQEIYYYDGSQIHRLTNNDYHDYRPRISGSNIAWVGNGIMYYDGATTRRIGDGNFPQISGNHIVWEWGGKIFLYDGVAARQISDSACPGIFPHISGDRVVWYGWDGNDHEVYLYDGSTTRQLTDDVYWDLYPQIDGTTVVWYGNDVYPSDQNYEILVYREGQIERVTYNTHCDWCPRISGDTLVWVMFDGNDYEIFWARPAASNTISGTVYFDTNNNGQLDSGEWRVPGATVQLRQPGYAADDYTVGGGHSATTDQSGRFVIPDAPTDPSMGTWDLAVTVGCGDWALQPLNPCAGGVQVDVPLYPSAYEMDPLPCILRFLDETGVVSYYFEGAWASEQRAAVEAALRLWLDALNSQAGWSGHYQPREVQAGPPSPGFTFRWTDPQHSKYPLAYAYCDDDDLPGVRMCFNARSDCGWITPRAADGYLPNVRRYLQPGLPDKDLFTVALHELGHAFGLLHAGYAWLNNAQMTTEEGARQRQLMIPGDAYQDADGEVHGLPNLQHWLALGDVMGVWQSHAWQRDERHLSVAATCPVDVSIRDEDGRELGPSGSSIPQGMYAVSYDEGGGRRVCADIRDPMPGVYAVRVLPQPSARGTDTVSLRAVTASNEVCHLLRDVPIAELPSAAFLVHSTLGHTEVSASPQTLWPPNHELRDVTLEYQVSRAAVGAPEVTVTCNEPSFNAAEDVAIVDEHHIRLRAERDGQRREARLYTITVTLQDRDGNQARYQTTVTVPHDMGGGEAWITSACAVPSRHGAQISFTLSAEACVSATVLNLAGRPIRHLAHQGPTPAGLNSLLWNARSDSGVRVPAGTYLVELRAEAPDGSASRALVSVRLNR